MTPEQTSNETSTVSYDDALNEYYEEMNRYMDELATELGVSVRCGYCIGFSQGCQGSEVSG